MQRLKSIFFPVSLKNIRLRSILFRHIPVLGSALVLVLVSFTGGFCCMARGDANTGGPTSIPVQKSRVVPGEILVKFKPSTGEDRVRQIAAREGLEIIKIVSPPYLYLMKSREAITEKAISKLKEYKEVEYAEPNYVHSLP